MAVFSNIVQQKRVLDEGQLFFSSHVWYDSTLLRIKIDRVKGRFFNKIRPVRIRVFNGTFM